MDKTANAFLTNRYLDFGERSYDFPDGKNKTPIPMRTIEIKNKRGKPLMVLQSQDTQLSIEHKLRENGWTIVVWNGDNLQLNATPVINGEISSKQGASIVAKPKAEPNKSAAIGCLVLFVFMIILFVSCSASISSNNRNKETKPDVGSAIGAEIMCENAIKNKLNAPSTAKFSQGKYSQNEKTPTKYIIIGFVEAENRLGGMVGSSYRCDVTYSPETKEYTTETFLSEG